MGVEEAELTRLFERFYRADRARASRGTGLGLAIVKHVVNRHRGSLDIDSIPGGGSTFTVYLPAEESALGLRAAS
jgi:two-component system phosphate regulon sensor histidine kinase PhoR